MAGFDKFLEEEREQAELEAMVKTYRYLLSNKDAIQSAVERAMEENTSTITELQAQVKTYRYSSEELFKQIEVLKAQVAELTTQRDSARKWSKIHANNVEPLRGERDRYLSLLKRLRESDPIPDHEYYCASTQVNSADCNCEVGPLIQEVDAVLGVEKPT